ncbi:hypothetical protein LOY64_13340 [Pseudomonas corrugata]|uniref:hypothetical protein n=1 Tax=Pseudomonas corrugata TaxID=47879 RepID=UPI002231F371|nr:hypothetical protein [Pseudomonas corrugata]UZD97925.1 hypothetical protein LOY64_13340 [Pseudomonas corrugata]
MKKLSLVLALVSLAGCANFTSPARKSSVDITEGVWFDYDGSRRGAILIPSTTKVRICSEPSPDVALNLVSKLSGTIKKSEVGEATGNAEFNSSVVKLAERTQMIMFLRESLYRLCEQSLARDYTNAEVLAAYNRTIDTAVEIIKLDRAKADTEKAKAEAVSQAIQQGVPPETLQELIHQ